MTHPPYRLQVRQLRLFFFFSLSAFLDFDSFASFLLLLARFCSSGPAEQSETAQQGFGFPRPTKKYYQIIRSTSNQDERTLADLPCMNPKKVYKTSKPVAKAVSNLAVAVFIRKVLASAGSPSSSRRRLEAFDVLLSQKCLC